MGMGTVSWRQGSVCLIASISLLFTLFALALALSFKTTVIYFYFLLPLDAKLKGLISQKLGLSVHPWGCLPLLHILSPLFFLLYQKLVQVTKVVLDIPLPQGRLRAPFSSKPNGPFFRTLSDKHDLLIDLFLFTKARCGCRVVQLQITQERWI